MLIRWKILLNFVLPKTKWIFWRSSLWTYAMFLHVLTFNFSYFWHLLLLWVASFSFPFLWFVFYFLSKLCSSWLWLFRDILVTRKIWESVNRSVIDLFWQKYYVVIVHRKMSVYRTYMWLIFWHIYSWFMCLVPSNLREGWLGCPESTVFLEGIDDRIPKDTLISK
jgi:hypothetical protein